MNLPLYTVINDVMVLNWVPKSLTLLQEFTNPRVLRGESANINWVGSGGRGQGFFRGVGLYLYIN
jgi:hypothetical protein